MTSPPRAAAATAALTALALIAFAANSVLCRLALRGGEIGPLAFTALRLASGALVLLPFLCARDAERERWSPRSALALALYALGFSLAYLALDAGVGALLLFGAVQCTMLGAGLAAGERPTPLRALGIALACAGIVVLVRPGGGAPPTAGALWMLAAGAAWGAYSLAGRGARVPARATARNFLLAAPLGLAAWAVAPGAGASPRGVALAVISGALTSGLGYVLWYAALRGHTAISAAVVQLLVPVLAAAAGVVALGESAGPRLFLAAALTLGGVALAVLAPRRGPSYSR
jgi:drug/metabolite transporter (DMT)-like permease